MLPGISGSLIAPTYLETVIAEEFLTRPFLPARVRALAHWWRRFERGCGPRTSVRAVADAGAIPLFEALGFTITHLEPHGDDLVGALSLDGGSHLVFRVCPWGAQDEAGWRHVVRAGRTAGAEWSVVFTGATLRLLDVTRTWSRRALDFDLAQVFADERSVATLTGLLDAACTASHLRTLVERSDRHAHAVCRTLGTSVVEAIGALVSALDRSSRGFRTAPEHEAFEQAVTVVYRLLFLLFAEARAMVPTWHYVYRNAYTVEALCEQALVRPSPRGMWAAVQAMARLAHRGCRAGDLVVTPFNGRLFSPRHAPIAERARVPDRVAREVVLALTTTAGSGRRHRVAYADLGVEQLGAVYERVLEFRPVRSAGLVRLTKTSTDRKNTGSFYTPRAMTDFLVRRALHPLVEGRTAEEILNLRILDPAMGSGAFLVSACRYLSEATERALVADGRATAGRTREERLDTRRLVAQRCLFGVDQNPMAVQLAKLSLWLASVATDRPLTFLDHHLAAGNSLIGARLSDLQRRPCRGVTRPRHARDELPLFGGEVAAEMTSAVLPARFRIALEPGDTVAAVRHKEQCLAALSAPDTLLSRWKRAADLWCAAWFWEGDRLPGGVFADLLEGLTGGPAALAARQRDEILDRAATLASRHGCFHWELEFPEVFFTPDGSPDPAGGFDAVIGNPPWDVLRADSGDDVARGNIRRAHAARLRFFRESGIYGRHHRGHFNSYQLFVERALQLVRDGGRVALVLPSGFATDHGSAGVRRHLLDALSLDRLIGFDNRQAIFPIHRDVRFLLLTGTAGSATDRVTGTFGMSDAAWLDRLPDDVAGDPPDARLVSISRSLISSWDSEHGALPWLTDPRDVELIAQITSRVPRLAQDDGWAVRFGRELNATEDRRHLVPLPAPAAGPLLPVLEGKQVEPFRANVQAATFGITPADAARLVNPRSTYGRTRLAYRDVASATNRLTLIAARLPADTLSTHTLFCARTALGEAAEGCLLALLNSLVANYLVRLQVTTHVTTALMARLPVPRPPGPSGDFHELASLAAELETVGIEANPGAYRRVNAIAARLYGLTPEQYDYVCSTFPLLPPELRGRPGNGTVTSSAAKRGRSRTGAGRRRASR